MADEGESVLADRPELRDALETIRGSVAEDATWTFEDVPLDSGTFGEVVAADLVEKTDGGYRLPASTLRALGGETASTGSTDDRSLTALLPDVDRRAAGSLAAALAVVVVFRTAFSFGAVFRNGDVVLSGNDPYFYRYHVEQLLGAHGGEFALSGLGDVPIPNGEPLFVSVLWWVASALGDGAAAAGTTLAWYPVVLALVTAVFVYLLAVALTDDRRVALAAVLFFAVTPGHAMRTSLGFADHHAFDYVWLVLAALVLVALARRDEDALEDPVTWGLGVVLGFAVTGQVLAWENGPALIVPVALSVAVGSLLDVDRGRSPLRSNAPLLGGLIVAAVSTWVAHTGLGWHTDLVAYSPALLFGGAVGVVLVMEGVFRYDLPTSVGAGLQVVGGIGGILALRTVAPSLWADATERLGTFTTSTGVVETRPLFSGDLMWFLLLGLVVVVALPPLVWASARARDGETGWLVASVYTWYLLVLAGFQVRFVGELAAFTAVFGGFGFIWMAHWVDLGAVPGPFADGSDRDVRGDGGPDDRGFRVSLPSLESAGLWLALFLLVGGVGILQVPVKTNHLTIEEEAYRTASWMGDHAAEADKQYPADYVLSQWSRNRMFNYFVNGDSEGYVYARKEYDSLYGATDGERWYRDHRNDVGYVLIQPPPGNDPDDASIYSRLQRGYGSRTGEAPGLVHFRALYESSDGEYTAFEVVRGATITGQGPVNDSTVVSTEVTIPGASFTYERTVRTDRNGTYHVRVAYPGEYRLWDSTVQVSEQDVTGGDEVTI
jgi:dolichyl-diphosphooligosaccharide--protein glycosyltransferase